MLILFLKTLNIYKHFLPSNFITYQGLRFVVLKLIAKVAELSRLFLANLREYVYF